MFMGVELVFCCDIWSCRKKALPLYSKCSIDPKKNSKSKPDKMKTIGILSDTHSYWDPKYLHYFEPCDEIWHAGDILPTFQGCLWQLRWGRPAFDVP